MDRNLYDKQTVMVQKKSGFDKSFQNLFTAKVGTIVPILTDELIPNTTVNLKAAISAQLPPLASDTFMRCKLKYAAFFVPTRILVNRYEDWLTDAPTAGGHTGVRMPIITVPAGATADQRVQYLGPGTLADYLGFKTTTATVRGLNSAIKVQALPFLAYHRIYEDWFRNSVIQKSIYVDVAALDALDAATARQYAVSRAPFVSPSYDKVFQINPLTSTSSEAGSPIYADGVHLMSTRQANFDIDLFTSCMPQAQNGNGQTVSLKVTTGNTPSGEFTISALRAANSIQQFLERNNIAGNRIVDFVKANYGANLSDGVAQRAVLLGSGSFDVYSKGIYQTAAQSGTTNNPFNSVAAKYGSAFADGNDTLVENFTAMEPGYLMVVCWLSPKATYSTGVDPILDRYIDGTSGASQRTEMANPLLQNVGNEPLQNKLITDKVNSGLIFGYNDRYCTWKDKFDEVHGLLRDGESLKSFALQRTFTTDVPTISTSFLQIPTNYLDQVSAAKDDVSKYGYWCDTYFDYKVSMPLARYSIPSLQNPAEEHGEAVTVNRGGTHLS